MKEKERQRKARYHASLTPGLPPQRKFYNAMMAAVRAPQNNGFTRNDEAVNSPDAKHWREAMQRDVDCLTKHNACHMVKNPENATIAKGNWVYTTKKEPNRKNVRYEARRVVIHRLRGFIYQTRPSAL